MTATSEQPRRQVCADLGWSLDVLLREYAQRTSMAFRLLPGGERGYRVLELAATGSYRKQSDLADATGLDRTVLTYLIDDLESAGLVARLSEAHDRRSRRVIVTSAGARQLAEASAKKHAVEEDLLSGMPEREASALRVLLVRAARSLDSAGSYRLESAGKPAR